MKVAIEACAKSSHAGEQSFGEAVRTLAAAGVESHLADYRRGEKIYYPPSGEALPVPLPTLELPVADEFTLDGVRAAVRGAQSGEVKYPEFVRRTMMSGCSGYFVWIAGRHVRYFGRRGESHVEEFPSK